MATNTCPQCNAPNRVSARFCANCGAPLLQGVSPARPMAQDVPTLPLGTELQGRYRIEEELGRGGFGAVYRAFDFNLNRFCAIKENLDTSPEAQRQFMREATVLANLSHPNLPRVTDHFIIPDQGQYLVMDFVEGQELASLLQEQKTIPVQRAVEWILQVADALTYMHSQTPPVVHRDIKPANIIITPMGRAMLVDFGLVKVYDPHLRTTLGARAVTPGYAPPEQYGQATTDSRTDIYALGATLYYLLTGQDPPESVARVASEEVLALERINPQLPAALCKVVARAMAIKPANRYQGMGEFKRDLEAWLQGRQEPSVSVPEQAVLAKTQVAAPPVERTYPQTPKEAQPKLAWKTWLLGIAVVVVLSGLGIIYALMQTIVSEADLQNTVDARVIATRTARARLTATAQGYLPWQNVTLVDAARVQAQDAYCLGGVTAMPSGTLFPLSVSIAVMAPSLKGGILPLVELDRVQLAGQLSPDQQWIAFLGRCQDTDGDGKLSEQDFADVFVVRADFSEVARLTNTTDRNEVGVRWFEEDAGTLFLQWSDNLTASWRLAFYFQ